MSDTPTEVETADQDEAFKLTPEVVFNVMRIGRVIENVSLPLTDEEHIEGFKRLVEGTRRQHGDNMGETNQAHSLGLAIFPVLQVSFTGFSPNAPSVNATLAFAWNRLVRDCEEALAQQEIIESRRAEEGA